MNRSTDYTVLITKELRTGTNEVCYVAKVPTLDIATEAGTKMELGKAIQDLINFHLECLTQEEESIPVENNPLLTKVTVHLPKNAQITAN
jgi:predicted RNase H-like HicB family nuclease